MIEVVEGQWGQASSLRHLIIWCDGHSVSVNQFSKKFHLAPKNLHLEGLIFRLKLWKRRNTLRRASNESVKSVPRTITSSKYMNTSSNVRPRRTKDIAQEKVAGAVQRPWGNRVHWKLPHRVLNDDL